MGHGVFERLQIVQSVLARHRFDAAHTGGHTALAHHLEQANVARGFDVGAPAQLAAGADVEHAHGLAVLLAKQHHGACFLGRLNVHHTRLGSGIGQDFGVHTGFDLAHLRVRHGRVVGKVKARALGIHQAAFLLNVVAQHFAQGLVHQVRGRVVAHRGGAGCGVHLGLHMVAHGQGALGQGAVVAKHIGFDFLGVGHRELGRAAHQHAFVAHLTAALGVERGGVQHHHTTLAVLEFGHRGAVQIHRHHLGFCLEVVVAHKGVARARVVQGLVHLELASGTGLVLLLFHRGVKARFVHAQTSLTAHVCRQVERKAVGVMQLEGYFSGQLFDAAVQGCIQNLHADL